MFHVVPAVVYTSCIHDPSSQGCLVKHDKAESSSRQYKTYIPASSLALFSTMASAPDDETIKARIIKHLNNDHLDSLVLYLEHYAHLSSFTARSAQLTSLSLNSLTISAAGATHTIPFPSGPLKSFSEVRPAVVAMDQSARSALSRSPITVKTYVPPTGIGLAFAIFATYNFITMTAPDQFYLPGTWLYETVYRHVPAFADFTYKAAPYVWWMIFLGHGVEAPTMMWPRLKKHNVPLGSALWWKWAGSQFFLDGMGTLTRFDKLVQAEEAKKAKASH